MKLLWWDLRVTLIYDYRDGELEFSLKLCPVSKIIAVDSCLGPVELLSPEFLARFTVPGTCFFHEATCPLFYVGARNLNAYPCSCTANSLASDWSPQPFVWVLQFVNIELFVIIAGLCSFCRFWNNTFLHFQTSLTDE